MADGLIYIYCAMISTIGLVDIHHLIQTQKEKKNKTFPCDENLEFTLNFPVYHRAMLAIVILYVTSLVLVLIYLLTGSLNLLIPSSSSYF